MRIVFFGTSNVALPVLEALSRQHEIVAVVTQPDKKVGRKQDLQESPVSVLATEMKVKLLKPITVKNNDIFRAELQSLAVDVFIIVSYGKILPAEILAMPKYKTLNVHFSLLPKYRGASPIQYALLSGETSTGTTIFILDEQLDHGPVLAQETMAIEPDDNFLTLSEKMAHASARLLVEVLPKYISGEVRAQEQDHSLATASKIITKADAQVDWSKTAQEIYNQFRAFYPWPGLWTQWNGTLLKITDCLPSQFSPALNVTPGSVLDNGVIACGGQTALEIHSLQLAGKNQTDILSFLNGYRNFTGSFVGFRN